MTIKDKIRNALARVKDNQITYQEYRIYIHPKVFLAQSEEDQKALMALGVEPVFMEDLENLRFLMGAMNASDKEFWDEDCVYFVPYKDHKYKFTERPEPCDE